MHQRKVIRDAVVAALTSATDAGPRVKASRVGPLRDPTKAARLPALAVYTPAEDIDPDADTAPRELLRHLILRVTGWVVDTAAVPADDAMDALAEQIEAAMELDRYFGGAAGGEGSILVSTEAGVLDDGDPLIGEITLTYRVEYFTSPTAQPAVTDNYLRTGTTTQIDGAGANNTVGALFSQRPNWELAFQGNAFQDAFQNEGGDA